MNPLCFILSLLIAQKGNQYVNFLAEEGNICSESFVLYSKPTYCILYQLLDDIWGDTYSRLYSLQYLISYNQISHFTKNKQLSCLIDFIYLKYAIISICNVSCFYYNTQVSFINNKNEDFFYRCFSCTSQINYLTVFCIINRFYILSYISILYNGKHIPYMCNRNLHMYRSDIQRTKGRRITYHLAFQAQHTQDNCIVIILVWYRSLFIICCVRQVRCIVTFPFSKFNRFWLSSNFSHNIPSTLAIYFFSCGIVAILPTNSPITLTINFNGRKFRKEQVSAFIVYDNINFMIRTVLFIIVVCSPYNVRIPTQHVSNESQSNDSTNVILSPRSSLLHWSCHLLIYF